MSDATSVGRTVAAVHENYGRIDALINNAARGLYGIVEKVEIASYRAIWALNVEGPLIAMQKVIPLMRAQGGGSMVDISSMVSKNYFPRIGAYASTKYALNALSLTARAELAPDHIIVSVVYPGLVETDLGRTPSNLVKRRAGWSPADASTYRSPTRRGMSPRASSLRSVQAKQRFSCTMLDMRRSSQAPLRRCAHGVVCITVCSARRTSEQDQNR